MRCSSGRRSVPCLALLKHARGSNHVTGLEASLQQYGWLGFLVYVLVKEVWPFFRDKLWPQRVEQAKAERERLKLLEDRATQIEERQTKALESLSQSTQQMALAITTNNERLTMLITGHSEHDRFTRDAVQDMRDIVVPKYKPKRTMKVKQ